MLQLNHMANIIIPSVVFCDPNINITGAYYKSLN